MRDEPPAAPRAALVSKPNLKSAALKESLTPTNDNLSELIYKNKIFLKSEYVILKYFYFSFFKVYIFF